MKKIVYAVCGLAALSCIVGCGERQYSAKECNAALKERQKWEQEEGGIVAMEIMLDVAKNKMTEQAGEEKYEKTMRKQSFSSVLASCDKSVKSGLLTEKWDRWGMDKMYADGKPQGK